VPETEQIEEDYDVTGAIRVGLDVVLTALCLYVMWGYVKDQPEVAIVRRRVEGWWAKVITAPQRLRKMSNEVVFEAIEVVDSVPGD